MSVRFCRFTQRAGLSAGRVFEKRQTKQKLIKDTQMRIDSKVHPC